MLFRLGGRGYATPRRRVRAVIDIGTGHPPVPGLRDSSLRALHPGVRPAALVSLRQAIGLPWGDAHRGDAHRGDAHGGDAHGGDAHGRILVVKINSRTVGFIVDQVLRVVDARADQIERPAARLGGYVSGRVRLGDDLDDWSLIEWDAVAPRGG